MLLFLLIMYSEGAFEYNTVKPVFSGHPRGMLLRLLYTSLRGRRKRDGRRGAKKEKGRWILMSYHKS